MNNLSDVVLSVRVTLFLCQITKITYIYQKFAWDNYRAQLRYAKDADEKAAMYLRWATQ